MQVVINHLTRMQPGYVCVAGVDLDFGRHVRPVLRGRRLSIDLLLRKGGPFDIAAIVDLGGTQYAGQPPETEDYYFTSTGTVYAGDMEPDVFWRMLELVSQWKLTGVFGDALKQRGKTYTVDVGAGSASLRCLRPAVRPVLTLDLFGAVRLLLVEGRFRANLPVTDLRLYEEDHRTPRHRIIEQVATRIQRGVPVVLSMGLTRPWQKPGDTAPRHWLQVNNIHLSDDPTWRDSR